MFKHPPFNAGKTAHLNKICLENSLKDSKANLGRLFVWPISVDCLSVKSIQMKLTQMFCYLVCYIYNV